MKLRLALHQLVYLTGSVAVHSVFGLNDDPLSNTFQGLQNVLLWAFLAFLGWTFRMRADSPYLLLGEEEDENTAFDTRLDLGAQPLRDAVWPSIDPLYLGLLALLQAAWVARARLAARRDGCLVLLAQPADAFALLGLNISPLAAVTRMWRNLSACVYVQNVEMSDQVGKNLSLSEAYRASPSAGRGPATDATPTPTSPAHKRAAQTSAALRPRTAAGDGPARPPDDLSAGGVDATFTLDDTEES